MNKFTGRSASYGDDPEYHISMFSDYLDYLANKNMKCSHENSSEESSTQQKNSQQGRIIRFIQFIWKRLRCTCTSCSASAELSASSIKNSNDPSISSDPEESMIPAPTFEMMHSNNKFTVKQSMSI